MAPTLYMTIMSPPCRATLLTAKALGLKLNLKEVDLVKREQYSPEFLKINPQHTIPTLDDDGVILWESHAINAYLVDKYGEDDSLYPKDLAQRALVDQRMYFDAGISFNNVLHFVRTVWLGGEKELHEDQIADILKCYGHLEDFLEGRDWMAGDSPTIADFSLLSSTTTLNVLVPVDEEKFPKLKQWMARGEELPHYGVNAEGVEVFEGLARMLTAPSS